MNLSRMWRCGSPQVAIVERGREVALTGASLKWLDLRCSPLAAV